MPKLPASPRQFGNLLILGRNDESTRLLVLAVHDHPRDDLRLVGILSDRPEEIGRSIEGAMVVGTIGQIREVANGAQARTVVNNLPDGHPDLPIEFLVEWKLSGNLVVDAAIFYEGLERKLLIERLEPSTVLSPGAFNMTRQGLAFKDLYERALALFILVAFAPLLLLIALLVRLSSPGPVIYRQRRVGKGEKPFTIFKFRTMIESAEEASGPVWCSRTDPRVTAIGMLLRRTHLDELPQLINILRGEMAFVGPRPERPEFVRELERKIDFYNLRHLVKPGLTGWAQVSFNYAASLEDSTEKLRYDLYYIKYMAPVFDWRIILATIRASILGTEEPRLLAAPRDHLKRLIQNASRRMRPSKPSFQRAKR